jgi:hypothetical protein
LKGLYLGLLAFLPVSAGTELYGNLNRHKKASAIPLETQDHTPVFANAAVNTPNSEKVRRAPVIRPMKYFSDFSITYRKGRKRSLG